MNGGQSLISDENRNNFNKVVLLDKNLLQNINKDEDEAVDLSSQRQKGKKKPHMTATFNQKGNAVGKHAAQSPDSEDPSSLEESYEDEDEEEEEDEVVAQQNDLTVEGKDRASTKVANQHKQQ